MEPDQAVGEGLVAALCTGAVPEPLAEQLQRLLPGAGLLALALPMEQGNVYLQTQNVLRGGPFSLRFTPEAATPWGAWMRRKRAPFSLRMPSGGQRDGATPCCTLVCLPVELQRPGEGHQGQLPPADPAVGEFSPPLGCLILGFSGPPSTGRRATVLAGLRLAQALSQGAAQQELSQYLKLLQSLLLTQPSPHAGVGTPPLGDYGVQLQDGSDSEWEAQQESNGEEEEDETCSAAGQQQQQQQCEGPSGSGRAGPSSGFPCLGSRTSVAPGGSKPPPLPHEAPQKRPTPCQLAAVGGSQMDGKGLAQQGGHGSLQHMDQRAFRLWHARHMLKVDTTAFVLFGIMHAAELLVPMPEVPEAQLSWQLWAQGWLCLLPALLLLHSASRQWYCRYREVMLLLVFAAAFRYVHFVVPAHAHAGPSLTAAAHVWLATACLGFQMPFWLQAPLVLVVYGLNTLLLPYLCPSCSNTGASCLRRAGSRTLLLLLAARGTFCCVELASWRGWLADRRLGLAPPG